MGVWWALPLASENLGNLTFKYVHFDAFYTYQELGTCLWLSVFSWGGGGTQKFLIGFAHIPRMALEESGGSTPRPFQSPHGLAPGIRKRCKEPNPSAEHVIKYWKTICWLWERRILRRTRFDIHQSEVSEPSHFPSRGVSLVHFNQSITFNEHVINVHAFSLYENIWLDAII